MEKLKEKYVSQFAKDTASQIEDIISLRTGVMEGKLIVMQEKVLDWYHKTKDESFAKHFGIKRFK